MFAYPLFSSAAYMRFLNHGRVFKPSGLVRARSTRISAAFVRWSCCGDGDALNVGFAQASSNLQGLNLLPAVGANVYDIMRHETLVLTRAAVEKLEARFNG
mgnify:CR=1 FL=1